MHLSAYTPFSRSRRHLVRRLGHQPAPKFRILSGPSNVVTGRRNSAQWPVGMDVSSWSLFSPAHCLTSAHHRLLSCVVSSLVYWAGLTFIVLIFRQSVVELQFISFSKRETKNEFAFFSLFFLFLFETASLKPLIVNCPSHVRGLDKKRKERSKAVTGKHNKFLPLFYISLKLSQLLNKNRSTATSYNNFLKS
jgi:hypothetical protein